VVVHDLDLLCIAILPNEADPILIIDPDAVQPSPISRERLQVIARERAQVVESLRRVQLQELSLSDAGNAPKPSRRIALEERFGFSVPEAPDHPSRVLRVSYYVKRYSYSAGHSASLLR
jgi:hypothetical protein